MTEFAAEPRLRGLRLHGPRGRRCLRLDRRRRGRPGEGLHGDRYDFNDAIVPVVLDYWVKLVRQVLPALASR